MTDIYLTSSFSYTFLSFSMLPTYFILCQRGKEHEICPNTSLQPTCNRFYVATTMLYYLGRYIFIVQQKKYIHVFTDRPDYVMSLLLRSIFFQKLTCTVGLDIFLVMKKNHKTNFLSKCLYDKCDIGLIFLFIHPFLLFLKSIFKNASLSMPN